MSVLGSLSGLIGARGVTPARKTSSALGPRQGRRAGPGRDVQEHPRFVPLQRESWALRVTAGVIAQATRAAPK